MAKTSPSSIFVPFIPIAETLGTDFPACIVYRSILWPVKLLMGRRPTRVMVVWTIRPISDSLTPGLNARIAFWRALAAALANGSNLGFKQHVTEVSVT